MRVTVVHGYFLQDSGSGTDVRELTSALVAGGHDVTLVCQERRPELFDFINAAYKLDESNANLSPLWDRSDATPGCRFVRPDLGGRLLVYMEGPFPGFERSFVRGFQNAPQEWIDSYVDANVRALTTVFDAWPPDLVLSHHAIMQPCVVARASRGRFRQVAALHGSELNYSLKLDPRLIPYAAEGLSDAVAIAAVSPHAADDMVSWTTGQGIEIEAKTTVVPPGLDADNFAPARSREEAIADLTAEGILPAGFALDADDDILASAGRLIPTKGVQHAIAALPLIAASRPNARLLIAGDGPGRESLERLAAMLEAGDAEGARRLAEKEAGLATPPEYGPLVVGAFDERGRQRVAFLGHLPHDKLAKVFAAADLSLSPTVFPEALGLVNIEALSAGSLPLAGHHSGMAALVDLVSEALGDVSLRSLVPGSALTTRLADLAVHALDSFPTADPVFRARLHELATSLFPSWDQAAKRYIELGGSAPPRASGEGRVSS